MDNYTKKRLLDYVFFILQLITIILLIKAGKSDNVKEVIFVIALFVIYIFVEAKYNLHMSNYIRGCMMALALLHTYPGKYLDLYLTSTIFDKALHVFGTYAIALFAYSLMDQVMGVTFTHRRNKFVFIAILGISLGAIFEIIEFVADNTLNPMIHNQPNLTDTNLDMVADVFGALIAALHSAFGGIPLHSSRGKS
ncbi:MAG: hypothetical protein A4E53_01784 [Pelotomaculum sp. PtaB.Bin104]|nr:MAG: hypothetical protein A4E53_01784 [Pelotomaculum sp. PtaB.Bin104]